MASHYYAKKDSGQVKQYLREVCCKKNVILAMRGSLSLFAIFQNEVNILLKSFETLTLEQRKII